MSLADSVIRHNIRQSSYGNRLSRRIDGLMQEAAAECSDILRNNGYVPTRERVRDIQKRVKSSLLPYGERIDSAVAEILEEIESDEQEWIEQVLSEMLGARLRIPANVRSVLESYPFSTAGTISGFAKDHLTKLLAVLSGIAMSSYITGASLSDVTDENGQKLSSAVRSAVSDARTIGGNAGNVYDRIVYTANERKIKGYVWSAILDTGTCLVCGARDGMKFSDISRIPLYPVHQNDRCTIIPYTDETEAMLPKSYSEWFELQDEETKTEILGPARYALYKGGMKIQDFSANGRIFTLKELISSKK